MTAADLPIVAPWFDNPETQRWLGGRDWPRQGLGLVGPDRQLFLALDGTLPVGLLDCETYPDGSASFALVTAPEQRNRGVGRAMLGLLIGEPRYAGTTCFFAGIERGNLASAALMKCFGFIEGEEDEDGFTHFEYRRP
jgi:ribosomal protein S18 acetylase RimI-like enzyme